MGFFVTRGLLSWPFLEVLWLGFYNDVMQGRRFLFFFRSPFCLFFFLCAGEEPKKEGRVTSTLCYNCHIILLDCIIFFGTDLPRFIMIMLIFFSWKPVRLT